MIEEKNISHLKDTKERISDRKSSTNDTHYKSNQIHNENRVGATGAHSPIDEKFEAAPKTIRGQRLRQRVGGRLKDIGGRIETHEFKMSSASIATKVAAYPMQSLGFALLLGFLLGIALS